MDNLYRLLWAILPGIITGIFMAIWNGRQKKRDAEDREDREERVRAENLKLNLLLASAQLAYACTMALKRGSTNGEVEPAVEQYNKAMGKFRAFEREQLAKAAEQ